MNYILTFFVVLSMLFGGLSYKFYGDKDAAEQSLSEVKGKLDEAEKSKETSIFSCEITDSILTEWQKDLQENQAKSDSTVTAIDKLPSKTQKVTKDEVSDVVDIDGKLDPELIRLLFEASNRDQGGSVVDAK